MFPQRTLKLRRRTVFQLYTGALNFFFSSVLKNKTGMRVIDDPRLCKLVTFSLPAVVTFIFLSVRDVISADIFEKSISGG